MSRRLRVEDIGRPDGVKVSGRGELHLSIHRGNETGRSRICVSKPEVITRKKIRTFEPMEDLTIDVPEEYQRYSKTSRRKARLVSMDNTQTGLVRLSFQIPTGTYWVSGRISYRHERPWHYEYRICRIWPMGRHHIPTQPRKPRQPDTEKRQLPA